MPTRSQYMKYLRLCILAQTLLPLVPQAARAADTDPQPNASLDEIVVTAQHRAESSQHAPIAINAISGDDIKQRGVARGDDLEDLVPAVKIQNERGGTSVFIRGIGNSAANPYGDPAVTFNIDGVPLALPSGPNGLFFDLARVEILKGPQGTLYGRNATGGDVNVISNDPQDELAGSAEVTMGNYALFSANGMINVPLVSDKLAVRAAFQTYRHDGYLSDGHDDADDVAGRLKVLWTPTDDIRLLLGADFAHQSGKGAQRVPLNASTGSYYWSQSNPWHLEDTYPSPVGGSTTLISSQSSVINRNYGIWGQLDWTMGPVILTAIPAYYSLKQNWNDSDSGFPIHQVINDTSKTLEVRLASNDAVFTHVKWVVGVFGLDEKLPNTVTVQTNYPPDGSSVAALYQVTQQPVDKTTSLAAFGQVTLSLTDKLRLTGGIRYTHDKKHQEGYTTNDITTTSSYTFYQDWTVSYNKTNWKVGLDYDLRPDSLLYASVSTGYKAGGFGALPTPSLNPGLTIDPAYLPLFTYAPTTITAYTLGSKNEFLNHRLRVNVELFDWEYANHQVQTVFLLPLPNGLPSVIVPAIVNAGKGHARGVDLDVTYQITPNDRLGFDVEYLDTAFADFSYPSLFLNNLTVVHDKPFTDSPKWSGDVFYTHVWDLADGGSLSAGVRSHLTQGYWVGYGYNVPDYQKGYTRSQIDIGYTAPDDRWHLSAWVRNLENRAVKFASGGAIPGTSDAPAPVGTDGQSLSWAEISPPRTAGITFGASF